MDRSTARLSLVYQWLFTALQDWCATLNRIQCYIKVYDPYRHLHSEIQTYSQPLENGVHTKMYVSLTVIQTYYFSSYPFYR